MRRISACVLWLCLLGAVFLLPYWTESATLGDDITRNTVRVSLLYYAIAAALLTTLARPDFEATTERGRLTRLLWTLAWLAYIVHLGAAFHYYHGWSHDHAVEHTREVSGVGEGIYISHFFTLVWTADVLAWWLSPTAYAARSPWWGRLLHGFMAFIIFNATVVYEQGPIRWAGLALLSGLGALCLLARWRQRDGRLLVDTPIPPHL